MDSEEQAGGYSMAELESASRVKLLITPSLSVLAYRCFLFSLVNGGKPRQRYVHWARTVLAPPRGPG
jgi:hypothetical protein